MFGTPAGTTQRVARCVLISNAPCDSSTAREQVGFGTRLMTALLANSAAHTLPATNAPGRREQLHHCGNVFGAPLYIGRTG